MSNESFRQITAKELYEDWVVNPHYNFVDGLRGMEVVKIIRSDIYEGWYQLFYAPESQHVASDRLINLYPKQLHPTEMQGPSDLDATLPIVPAEMAQRDHDEIQRLRAENAKMRGFIQDLAQDTHTDEWGKLTPYVEKAKELLGELDQ